MLSRLKLSESQERRVEDLIPYFERERERIQLFDRINDYRQVLTDEEIEKQKDQVQYFHYFGEPIKCHRAFPHPPHVVGYYRTVRYGFLPIYCTGRSGIILLKNGKRVKLEITKDCKEDCVGKYILFELMEE
jgi:hypothetical protein